MDIRNKSTRTALALIALAGASIAYAADDAKQAATEVKPAATAPAAKESAAAAGATETGLAAVYSDSLHGRKTASGEVYDRNKLTAAHKTLPFGTQVKITNIKNQKTAVVRINDRGPTQAGRILDISPRVAKELGIHPRGMAEVAAEVVGQAPGGGKK